MACAFRWKRSNFTCVLQRTQGLGVVPLRYDCTNGVMTFSWKLRSRFSVKWGMSSFQATRRASARSSSVQQPPYVVSAAARLSYICIDRPTTSWPAALRMYAAVEESTPPDIATAIFIAVRGQGTGDGAQVVFSRLHVHRQDNHLSPVLCALSPNTRYRLCMPESEWSNPSWSSTTTRT